MAGENSFDARPDLGRAAGLAVDVLSRIRDRQAKTASGARQFILDGLLHAVIRRRDFSPGLVLAELRGHRLTPDAIIDTYVPSVARQLGDMWIASDLSFAEVTVGSMRLQSLLGACSAEMVPVLRSGQLALAALVVVPEGEQHFLGASTLSAQLRRCGVAVSISFGDTDAHVLARVEMDAPDMVLFSVARPEALEVVARTVTVIRRSVRPCPVLALGGAYKGDAATMKNVTDVDLVTSVTKTVVGTCMKRLQAAGRD